MREIFRAALAALWLTAALVLTDLARATPGGRGGGDLAGLAGAGLLFYGAAAAIVMAAVALAAPLLGPGRSRPPAASRPASPLLAGVAAFVFLSGAIFAGLDAASGARRIGAPALVILLPVLLGAAAGGWLAARAVRAAACRGAGRLPLVATALLPLVGLGIVASPSIARSLRREAPAPRPARELPDIVLVVADSLRADALHGTAPADPPTPSLDALASRGVTLASASAAAPAGVPSEASLLTGRLPSEHGARWREAAIAGDAVTLAEALRSSGYRTGAFVSSPTLSERQGLGRGFDRWDGTKDPRLFARYPGALFSRLVALTGRRARTEAPPAGEVLARALGWIEKPSKRPAFLYVHLADPHEPYAPPSDGGGPSGSVSLDPYLRGEAELDDAAFGRLEDLYRGEVSYLDREVGSFLDALRPRLDGGHLLVVFTSNHGEELRDHGSLGHGHTLYEELLHVPLILARPGEIPAGASRPDPVSLVDLAPTILDLAGLPAEASFHGRSVAALVKDGSAPAPSPIVAELDAIGTHTMRHWSRSARLGATKVILTSTDVLGAGAWHREIFDLATDPEETSDLTEPTPESERLEEWLDGWIRDHPPAPGIGPGDDPVPSPAPEARGDAG